MIMIVTAIIYNPRFLGMLASDSLYIDFGLVASAALNLILMGV